MTAVSAKVQNTMALELAYEKSINEEVRSEADRARSDAAQTAATAEEAARVADERRKAVEHELVRLLSSPQVI